MIARTFALALGVASVAAQGPNGYSSYAYGGCVGGGWDDCQAKNLAYADCSLDANFGSDACKCLFYPCATVTDLGDAVDVEIPGVGPVRGKNYNDALIFIGVPTAQSTTGANRFKPPVAYTWTDTYEAYEETACPQETNGFVGGTEACLSLDIYTKDDWLTDAVKKPIAMWIHGGGFVSTNPWNNFMMNFPIYQSEVGGTMYVPEAQRVILAYIKYRLGALGWMAHNGLVDPTSSIPGFPGTNAVGSGNYGMMDSMHAIYWASQNMGAFGGDTSKITVFGESAGGAHTAMLMASELLGAQNYVQAFIAQSPFISFSPATYSMKARVEMGQLYVYRSCLDQNVVSEITTTPPAIGSAEATAQAVCLRSATATSLIMDVGFGTAASAPAVAAFDALYGGVYAYLVGGSGVGASQTFLYNSIHVWPVVDGFVLTLDPLTAYSTSLSTAAATNILGHNNDEYSTFCFGSCYGQPDPVNVAWVLALEGTSVDDDYSSILSAVIATYVSKDTMGTKMYALVNGLFYSDVLDQPAYGSDRDHAGIQMDTDAWFTTGTLRALEAMDMNPNRAAGSVFHFVFGVDTDADFTFLNNYLGIDQIGACHGCELTYVLGFYAGSMTFFSSLMPYPVVDFTFEPSYQSTGFAMNYYWSSTFHNGVPLVDAGAPYPTWEPFSVAAPNVMAFQDFDGVGAAMNPCVQFVACRVEPIYNFRSAIKTFWSTGLAWGPTADLVPATCTDPVGGLSFSKAPNTIDCPTPVCEPWCNTWTTGMAQCANCPVSTLVDGMAYCAGWCNEWTCGLQMCAGCDTCSAVRDGTYCAWWCNPYTTWSDKCVGC